MDAILQSPVRDTNVIRGDCTMENSTDAIGLAILRPILDRLGIKLCLQ